MGCYLQLIDFKDIYKTVNSILNEISKHGGYNIHIFLRATAVFKGFYYSHGFVGIFCGKKFLYSMFILLEHKKEEKKMNKNYSLLVGVLAGSLLFSTHSAQASMTTGDSNTTSEAKSYETQSWNSPFQYKYNFNKSQRNSSNALKENETSEKATTSEKPVTPAQSSEESTKENVQVSSDIQQVVDLVNSERAKAGLKALQIDTKLTQSAQAKSQDMKNKNYFSHTSPTYGSPFDQMKSLGITYKSAGENIAMGQRTAAEVMDAWMKSPGHKANIMNPAYTHIGVGLSDSGYYWTQQFIGK